MSDANVISAAKKSAKPQAAPKKQGELRRVLGMLNRFLIGNRKNFVLAMLMLALESGFDLLSAYPLPWLVAYLTTNQAPPDLARIGLSWPFASLTSALVFVAATIILFALLMSLADSLSEIYLSKGGRRLGYNLRAALFGHLQKLSLAFFGKQRTGDLLTRVTSDVSALETFAIDSLKDIGSSIFLLVLALIALLTSAAPVALVALIMVPVLSVVSNYFADKIKSAAKKLRSREGELAAATQEMLTSIRVIQTYGSGGNQIKRFSDLSAQTMDTALYSARLQAWFSGIFGVLQSVTVVLVAVTFVYLLTGNFGYNAAQLLTFVGIIDKTFKPTKRLIKQWNEVGKILASVERIGEVLDRRPAVEDRPGATQAPSLRGHVEYRDVSFAYLAEPEDAKGGAEPQMRLALRGVNLSITPGEVVALVGGSGAGKSTFVQLLPRLYDPQMGQILIDGHDIREWTLDSLRSSMSMVLQEAILFVGTVAENIAYGRQDATREEIIAAAIQANAHEFIERLPEGYDTMLSERAANLSGGQRQRIAIARAFIRNSPVLILDEPTTGLDAESTDLVLLALRTLMKGKATIIISHDLNLIRNADKIAVVKQGEIVQIGSHRELLKVGGLYADLYHKQFGQAVEEVGGQIGPSVLANIPVAEFDDYEDEDEDEDDYIPVVPQKLFQTLMGQALPQPVSSKAFQTLMMQVPDLSKSLPPSAPAAQGQPASAGPISQDLVKTVPPSVPVVPVAKPTPAVPPTTPPPAAQPSAAQVTPAVPPATPPPAAQPPAAQVTPAVPPATPLPVAQPPAAQPRPAPAAQAAPQPPTPQPGPAVPPGGADKPRAGGNATTLMHALPTPDAARPEPPKQDVKATIQLSIAELQSLQGGQPLADQPLDTRQLDPQFSPALQRALPGMASAFDAELMRGYLQAALFGTTNPAGTITRCSTGEAGYLPDGSAMLRYKIDYREHASGETRNALIGGRILPDQMACAVYMRDKLAPLVALMRGRDELAAFARPAAIVEPLNLVVHAFPIDGELPTLVGATDRDRLATVLSEVLPEALDETIAIERCNVELVDYARQKRAVLRYEVEGQRQDNGRIERRTVYGKVFGDTSGAMIGPITAALRERIIAGGHARHINIPQTYGWRPDLQLSLLEAIPGEPQISELLKARLRGLPLPNTALSLEEMIEQSGRIAALLHTSNIKLGRRRTLDDEMAAIRQEMAPIHRFAPALGARLQRWMQQLDTYAEQSDALPLCMNHGDFTHGQIIIAGSIPGLVDFDSASQAEPALDLGQFLAYLRVADKKKEKDKRPAGQEEHLVEQLSERFLNSYLAASGNYIEDADRLRVRISVYKVVSLLRRAVRSWQKFKGGRTESALAILEEEIACLPQLEY